MPHNNAAGCRAELDRIARERIIILDGAMGSLIQREGLGEEDYRGSPFAGHPKELRGCNDLLCLTRPALVSAIHEAYLEAGADIVSTNSLNANALSLADYGLAERAYEISRAAGALARAAADRYGTADRRRFAAGSVGPGSRSASLSPDVNDPARRGAAWDELEAAYYDSARGLLDGGVHLLLLETFFDTLNAKAAIAAVLRLREERGDIPFILSASVSGPSGRLLSGQTVEAFAVSTAHGGPWALGLNCSLGAEKLLPHLEALAAASPFPVSCYPNAGLPDRLGNYAETPEETAAFMKEMFERRLVNVAGGCCGTTPAHIAAIAGLAKNYAPRRAPLWAGRDKKAPGKPHPGKPCLAGLEVLPLDKNFVHIGERTNVAGSRKFLRLVQQGRWEETLDIAREMIATGARIIDVCMDDALLDGREAMVRFLNLALADPDIARFPVMIDSSRWEILEAGLKCVQGKALVNSISLKEGEDEFLRRAALVRRYGAAAAVMLFDEEGQAQSYERKIAIAGRSFALLTAAGFPAEDIVFDPNVLTIATGMAEHDRYALDFIRACAWIREHCPGAGISGGVSNLSFSFRGNDEIRGALHAVFLRHAAAAGLSMAILNPAGIRSCEEIPGELREAAEDAILCRGEGVDYAARLLALAQTAGGPGGADNTAAHGTAGAGGANDAEAWRNLPPEERIVHGLLGGIDKYIAADALELYGGGRSCLDIIEGPLMRGIEEVGDRFGKGTMFLPQVIRSARVMKKAVAALEPYMTEPTETEGGGTAARQRIVLATVRGDVHDIGKNIVAVVLGCNGYEIRDLGVMVPAETILAAAKETGADCIGLSALISPSLDEMIRVAQAMEAAGFDIPLLIGGAAASAAHTALRIAPAYSGPVVYVEDAGRTPQAVRALLSPRQRPAFLEKLHALYEEARRLHSGIAEKRVFLSLEEARSRRFSVDWDNGKKHAAGMDAGGESTCGVLRGKTPGIKTARTLFLCTITQHDAYPAEQVIPLIDWESFCRAWDLRGGSGGAPGPAAEKEQLLSDARDLLRRLVPFLSLRAVTGLFPALSENEDVILYGGDPPEQERARFCFLRNQEKKAAPPGVPAAANYCLSDFILPAGHYQSGGSRDCLGLFALTAEWRADDAARRAELDRLRGDDYNAILAAMLANSLAEAFSEALHRAVWKELLSESGGAFAAAEADDSANGAGGASIPGIRPAFGYPACPDHRDKETVFALLEVQERIGLCLSDTAMIIPPSSICGMYFFNPAARYFGTGKIAPDQTARWAERKGISLEEARRRMFGL